MNGARVPEIESAETLLDAGAGKRLGYVGLPGGTGAGLVRLPVAVVTGTRPGPTAGINGSLHGDEYLGPASIAALLRRLSPDRVRGRVILTPTLNVGAFRAMRRADPATEADWNRIWSPGPSGSALPAAVAWARAELLGRSDLVLDLHSGGNRFLQAPFAVYPAVGGTTEARSSALAKACGLPWIWAHRDSILEGALITAAARKGKPAVLLEIAGEGKAEPAWVRGMVRAVLGALAHARIVAGRPPFRRSYRVFTGFTILRNREEGRWSRRVEPGDRVRPGQPLGHVLDPFDRTVETVASPRDAVVVGLCTYGFVPAGDYVAELAYDVHAEGAPSAASSRRSPRTASRRSKPP